MLPVRLASLALASVLSLAAAPSSIGGPPWLSIELPANPLDPTTKGAFLVVRTYHHDRSVPFPVEGRAEGVVNGQRKSLPLSFDRTAAEGVIALRKSWPSGSPWVLVITGMPGKGSVTALVSIGADGEVRQVKVPSRSVENGRWIVPTEVTEAEVETALARLATTETLGAR
ncbi:MAG TPA: hypothetical protein VFY20_10860 [Gemmatimonadales bacterium]|nr:hypothetical protein [Gemmatimonadales bacterium]